MLKRTLGFLCFLVIAAVIGFNFQRILAFGQAHEIRQSAQKAMDAQNWEHAIQIYEKGRQQYADNAAISLKLAWLYRKQNQPDKAEAIYKAVLTKEPDHKEALANYANLLENDPKRLNEAVLQLRKALKAHPEDAFLIGQIGNFYKRAGEQADDSKTTTRAKLYEQARYYYQQSLKRNPHQFQVHFNLGVIEQRLDNRQPAAKAYCEAIQLKPDSYEARYNLGVILSELNHLEESYRQMDKAIKILTEADDIGTAQKLALRVQTIKNRVYNSDKQSHSFQEQVPAFLNPKCLVQQAAQSTAETKH